MVVSLTFRRIQVAIQEASRLRGNTTWQAKDDLMKGRLLVARCVIAFQRARMDMQYIQGRRTLHVLSRSAPPKGLAWFTPRTRRCTVLIPARSARSLEPFAVDGRHASLDTLERTKPNKVVAKNVSQEVDYSEKNFSFGRES